MTSSSGSGRRSSARSRPNGRRAVSFATVREIVLALPGTEEGTSYGTPAFRVKGKYLLRLKEDGETLALRTTFEDRDFLMAADPDAFYITDHYRDYPAVLVRLGTVGRATLRELLEQEWRRLAPKSLVARHDAASAGGTQRTAIRRKMR